MLGAPLAALVGIGAVELWHMRTQRPWLATGLLLTTSGTLGLQLVTAITFAGKVWWLLPAIILFVAGVGLLMVSATRQLRRGAMVGFACVIVALLLTPGIWSGLTTFNTGGNSSPLPSAYSGKRSSPPSRPGSSAKPPSGFVNRNGLRLNQALLDYLEPRTQNTTYLMAVPSSMQGADYVIATGRPVLYLGGFGGMDPVVTVDEMVWLVTNGKLRYVYWDRGSAPGNPRPGSSNIFTWVAAHCTPVKDFETIPSNFGTSNGIPTTGPTDAVSAYPRFPGMQLSLYNCGS